MIQLLTLLLLATNEAYGFMSPASFRTMPRSLIRAASAAPDDECSLEDQAAIESCLVDEGYEDMRGSREYAMVTKVVVAEVESLRKNFDSHDGLNKIRFNKRNQKGTHKLLGKIIDDNDSSGGFDPDVAANMEYNQFVDDNEVVLVDTIRKPGMASISRAFLHAGPRKRLHFDASKVNAAIVTCGGLCPGLNNVIREVVHSLYYLYGANQVWGVQGGYNGFHESNHESLPPILLTNELVEDVHHRGGTILRSSRGGFDIDTILKFCQDYDIQQLYVIGGDGTHRGAFAIHETCMERKLNIAVAGIPKTIDNDVGLIDRSFGFQSAVEASLKSIETAKTEAQCFVPNGVGIVKLMGRSAGFLAAFAALGSGDVDLVLLPEVPIVLDGKDGILPFLRKRIQEKGYVVVVVAEGAGEELMGRLTEVDKGGNRKLPDVGSFLKTAITEYFEKFGEEASLKYVDPSYMVRSVPANGADSLYCMQLAQGAVHGAMAGKTGFSIGMINRSLVYVPIPQLVSKSPRSLDPYGPTWERILTLTGQPNTAPPKEDIVDPVVEMSSGLMDPIPH